MALASRVIELYSYVWDVAPDQSVVGLHWADPVTQGCPNRNKKGRGFVKPRPFFWCPRSDSNGHALNGHSPSNCRVCQFHHGGRIHVVSILASCWKVKLNEATIRPIRITLRLTLLTGVMVRSETMIRICLKVISKSDAHMLVGQLSRRAWDNAS